MCNLVPTHYPPTIDVGFAGAPVLHGTKRDEAYFRNYRNEFISRILVPRYDWGAMDIMYTASHDAISLSKSKKFDKFLKLPQSQFSMLDVGRQKDIDDFYMICQMHRDQYKDETGRLHPMDFLKSSDNEAYVDCTSKYLKLPERYVRYKDPVVWPLTLDRTQKIGYLPERALTGKYDPSSTSKYKR